jgi:hypothetical protein
MTKFKFFLVKWPNRVKNFTIKASNTPDALSKIWTQFPDWEISMFWPVWERKD